MWICIKGCSGFFFSQFTATPPSPTSQLETGDLQSSQRNASVQSLLLADYSLYNQWQPSADEGDVANFREFLDKTQYLMNTLYLIANP